MAARKTLAHSEEVRARIQASQLINALQNRALGKNKMDATAVNAARVLLSKVVPDLKAIEHSGPSGEPLRFTLYVPAKQ